MNTVNTVATNTIEVPPMASGMVSAQKMKPAVTTTHSTAQKQDTGPRLLSNEVQWSLPDPKAESITEAQLAEVHSFSRKLAKEYGATAAIILGYLGNRIQAVEEKRKDGLGYFTSIRQLGERYPYLSTSTIADTLAMLREEAVLKAENHNKYKYDRKLWYTFANPKAQKDAAWDSIRFQVGDAVKYGVVEAVILANLRYWVNENRKETPDYTWHRISADTLSKHLPFSPSSIRRALEHLVEQGAVERKRCHGFDNAFEYSILVASTVHQSNPEMHQSKVEMHQSVSEMHQSNPEIDQSKPEMHQSNPDNDIILVDSIGKTLFGNLPCEVRVGENTFITPPAAPSGSCVCFNSHTPPDETKAKEVTKAQDLPMSAEGVHSQVGVPVAEPDKETRSVSCLAGVSLTKPVLYARDFMKPPAGYVPSTKTSRLSLESAKALGSGHNKGDGVLGSSVVAVSSSAPSSSSASGSHHVPSGQGVVAPGPAQGTAKLIDARVVFPFAALPASMSSGLTDAELKQKAGALGEGVRTGGESPPSSAARLPEFRTKVMNGKV